MARYRTRAHTSRLGQSPNETSGNERNQSSIKCESDHGKHLGLPLWFFCVVRSAMLPMQSRFGSLRLRRHRVEAARLKVLRRPIGGLGQGQEPRGAGGEARGGRRLGGSMSGDYKTYVDASVLAALNNGTGMSADCPHCRRRYWLGKDWRDNSDRLGCSVDGSRN
jgi:hypothetical protein